jgi:hypothetical protein
MVKLSKMIAIESFIDRSSEYLLSFHHEFNMVQYSSDMVVNLTVLIAVLVKLAIWLANYKT